MPGNTTTELGAWVLHHPIVDISTSSSTYEKLGSIIFGGHIEWSIPRCIKVIAHKEAAAGDWACRIWDQTNSQVVAEITGQSNTTPAVVELTTNIDNVSDVEAIWEIQFKREGTGNKKAYMDGLSIVF